MCLYLMKAFLIFVFHFLLNSLYIILCWLYLHIAEQVKKHKWTVIERLNTENVTMMYNTLLFQSPGNLLKSRTQPTHLPRYVGVAHLPVLTWLSPAMGHHMNFFQCILKVGYLFISLYKHCWCCLLVKDWQI